MEPNKSKYLRDKNEKKESKYIRGKDDAPATSKYKKTDEDKDKKLSGRARYEQYLEREKERMEALAEEEISEPEQEIASVDEEVAGENRSGEYFGDAEEGALDDEGAAEELDGGEKDGESAKSIFKKKVEKPEVAARPHSNESPNKIDRVAVRMAVCSVVLTFAAIVLQMLTFHVPLTPLPFKMDMSAIPELLGAVAYGPLVGMAIVIIKNLVYMIIYQGAATASSISNFILDSTFVIIASLIYSRGMFSPRSIEKYIEKNNISKDRRAKQIIVSGLIAAVPTAAVSFYTVRYIVLPMIIRTYASKGYTEQAYIDWYQGAYSTLDGYLHGLPGRILPAITKLEQGILIYNVTFTFVKLVLVTLFVALVYRFLSDFMHYRAKPKKPPIMHD